MFWTPSLNPKLGFDKAGGLTNDASMCLRKTLGEDLKDLNKLKSIQLKKFAITTTHHSHTSLNDLSNIGRVEIFLFFKNDPDYSFIPNITHTLEMKFYTFDHV